MRGGRGGGSGGGRRDNGQGYPHKHAGPRREEYNRGRDEVGRLAHAGVSGNNSNVNRVNSASSASDAPPPSAWGSESYASGAPPPSAWGNTLRDEMQRREAHTMAALQATIERERALREEESKRHVEEVSRLRSQLSVIAPAAPPCYKRNVEALQDAFREAHAAQVGLELALARSEGAAEALSHAASVALGGVAAVDDAAQLAACWRELLGLSETGSAAGRWPELSTWASRLERASCDPRNTLDLERIEELKKQLALQAARAALQAAGLSEDLIAQLSDSARPPKRARGEAERVDDGASDAAASDPAGKRARDASENGRAVASAAPVAVSAPRAAACVPVTVPKPTARPSATSAPAVPAPAVPAPAASATASATAPAQVTAPPPASAPAATAAGAPAAASVMAAAPEPTLRQFSQPSPQPQQQPPQPQQKQVQVQPQPQELPQQQSQQPEQKQQQQQQKQQQQQQQQQQHQHQHQQQHQRQQQASPQRAAPTQARPASQGQAPVQRAPIVVPKVEKQGLPGATGAAAVVSAASMSSSSSPSAESPDDFVEVVTPPPRPVTPLVDLSIVVFPPDTPADVLLEAMRSNTDDARTQEAAIRALCVEAGRNEALVDGAAPAMVLRAMREFADDGALQVAGCMLLEMMANNDDNERLLMGSDADDAALRALRRHRKDAAVMRPALNMCWNLMLNPRHKARMMGKGAGPLIIATARDWPRNYEVLTAAMGALGNLANLPGHDSTLVDLGAGEVTLAALHLAPTSRELMREASRALGTLAHAHRNKIILLSQGACAALVRVLEREHLRTLGDKSAIKCIAEAIKTLGTLCDTKDSLEAEAYEVEPMHMQGAVRVVAELLESRLGSAEAGVAADKDAKAAQLAQARSLPAVEALRSLSLFAANRLLRHSVADFASGLLLLALQLHSKESADMHVLLALSALCREQELAARLLDKDAHLHILGSVAAFPRDAEVAAAALRALVGLMGSAPPARARLVAAGARELVDKTKLAHRGNEKVSELSDIVLHDLA
jgi:hypothetical protein